MTSWYGNDRELLDNLRRTLPPIFSRETASKMIGGIFSPRTLSNFDSAGTGPANKTHIGKKVAYGKEEFLAWLEGMMNRRASLGLPKGKIIKISPAHFDKPENNKCYNQGVFL